VSYKYCVQMTDVAADGGQAGEGFAFAEASVDEDASVFGFKEG